MTPEERALLREDPESLGESCNLTFSEIGRLFGYNQFLLPIIFFLI